MSLCPPPKVAQLNAKRDLTDPWFFTWRKVGLHEWAPNFPICVGIARGAHFFLTPSRILSHKLHDWGSVNSWENSNQISEWNIGNCMDSTNHFEDFIRKPILESCSCLTSRSPQLIHGHPKCFTNLNHTPSDFVTSSQCMSPTMLRMSLCIVSTCRNLAWPYKMGTEHRSWEGRKKTANQEYFTQKICSSEMKERLKTLPYSKTKSWRNRKHKQTNN